MLRAGAVIAGYRTERLLGTGGMGAVYLAAHPTLPRHDALKVLSAELSGNPDFRARFVREADVAAALDHPNIVSVYNRGHTEDGQLWIAMQFVDGTDAEAALRAGGMTPVRAVHIVAEVAKGLDYAHASGVVHRDVKPANFLLSGQAGPDERALLGDFGIARAFDDVGLTATGSVLATVAYAAPEVLSGIPFDGRADIYSLGCALFGLLTGQAPFPATNGAAAVMMAHLQRRPPRVTETVPSLPAELDRVVAIAMAKDPAARFGSASALAEAARAALSGSPVALRPLPSPGPAAHSGTAGAAGPWWQHSGSSNTRPATLGAPRRRRWWIVGAAAATAALLIGGTMVLAGYRHPGKPAEAADSAPTARPGPPSAAPGTPATDVPAAALRAILLTAAQLPGAGTDDEAVLEHDTGTFLDDAGGVDVSDCLGAWAPAQAAVYADDETSGVAAQALRAINKKVTDDGVVQAVVAFRSRLEAAESLQRQHREWDSCAGRTITVTTTGDATQSWELGRPGMVTGTVTLDARLRGGTAVCQHGINVRGNVLIDIRQCLPRGGNDVSVLVNATAEKMPRQ